MKTTTQKNKQSRRRFLQNSGALAAGGLLLSPKAWGFPAIIDRYGKPNSMINGVQIGVITYSFRGMNNDAESTLKYCVDSGISAIELMGWTAEPFAGMPENPYPWQRRRKQEGPLTEEQKKAAAERKKGMAAYAAEVATWRANASMEKFEQLRKMYNEAGVSIYAWKPSALGDKNTDAEILYAFKAAKALGASHVTVEIPRSAKQSKRLGKLAKKEKVNIGYHGHLQQTFTAWDKAMSQSKYNAINVDIGHYTAAGFDPLPFLEAKHEKIQSIHLKDRQSKVNGQKNLVWGEGDTPIVEALQTMRDNKYSFPGTIELEYKIPEGSDAVTEVQKCLEYCRKALEG
ncbi:MAG: sugar phosphate isomerase/epimerase family protein [Bacteroidia bacterium]